MFNIGFSKSTANLALAWSLCARKHVVFRGFRGAFSPTQASVSNSVFLAIPVAYRIFRNDLVECPKTLCIGVRASRACAVTTEVTMKPLHQRPDFPNYRLNRTSHQRRVIFSCEKVWVEAIGYLLAFFLDKHRLELYAGCFFFTHDHLDLGHPIVDAIDAEPRFSAFLEEFHWWVFWLLKTHGWDEGPVFNRFERTYQGPSLDAEQVWWDLVYDTAQAVTAGFVRRSKHYVGLVFQPENVRDPREFGRNALIDAIDPDRRLFPEDTLSVKLSIPRPFRHMSDDEYIEEFRSRLDAYESRVANPRARIPREAARICRRRRIGEKIGDHDDDDYRSGHPKPPRSTLRPQPVNSTIPELAAKYRAERREFWEEHDLSYQLLRSGARGVKFPAGSYFWRRRLDLGCLPCEPGCWVDWG
jgi:hypothetical protein